jgi:hypothetical protein
MTRLKKYRKNPQKSKKATPHFQVVVYTVSGESSPPETDTQRQAASEKRHFEPLPHLDLKRALLKSIKPPGSYKLPDGLLVLGPFRTLLPIDV